MNTKQSAARDLHKLGIQFRGILALADELDRIGSIEQAAVETEARLNAARAAEGENSARFAEALREVEVAQENAKNTVAEAQAKAKGIKNAAVEKAESIVRAAKTELEMLKAEIEGRKQDFAALKSEIDVATKERDHILNEISALRERLGH